MRELISLQDRWCLDQLWYWQIPERRTNRRPSDNLDEKSSVKLPSQRPALEIPVSYTPLINWMLSRCLSRIFLLPFHTKVGHFIRDSFFARWFATWHQGASRVLLDISDKDTGIFYRTLRDLVASSSPKTQLSIVLQKCNRKMKCCQTAALKI